MSPTPATPDVSRISRICQKTKRNIRIENPLPGGSDWTNRAAAQDYVDRGRAYFTPSGNLRFFDNDHAARSAYIAAENRELRRRRTEVGYDTGLASLNQIAGIPVLFPLKLLTKVSPTWRPRSLGKSSPAVKVFSNVETDGEAA